MKSGDMNRGGQSLLEVLIASSLGVILITGALTLIAPSLRGGKTFTRVQVGAALGRALADNVRVWAESDWGNIASLATSSAHYYYLTTSTSAFASLTGTENVMVSTTTYVRYFYIDDVGRDGSGAIAIGGGSFDPSTKQVTVVYGVASSTGNAPATSTMITYVTRSNHRLFVQTDWSGGAGASGTITSASVTNTYASSSGLNVTTTTGSILINL